MSRKIMQFGPWIGIPKENQTVCAVKDCISKGEPQVCPYDGRYHHHGCIHYEAARETGDTKRLGIEFRDDGWCWLCPTHYEMLVAAQQERDAKKGA